MVQEIRKRMKSRQKKDGDHTGMNDAQALDNAYDDSDMHNEDFLADPDDMDMEMSMDNEMGNEDQDEDRREAKARKQKRMSRVMKPVEMGHGDDNAPGKF